MIAIISLLILSAASLLDASPVVYGIDVKVVKYPFLVYLEITDSADKDNFNICGGTLIGHRTILTAAHCLDTIGVPTIEIFAGFVHLSDKKKQKRKATLYKKHGNYKPLIPASNGVEKQEIQNDIAIVWVTEPFALNEKVSIAPLPKSNPVLAKGFKDTALTFLGWGSSETDRDEDQLKEGPGYAMTAEKCLRIHKKDATFICVEKRTPATTCFGDSGGPLLYKNEPIGVASSINAYVQKQETATTKKPEPGAKPTKKPKTTTTTEPPAEFSCRSKALSSFMNIYRYVEWIEANMNPPRA